MIPLIGPAKLALAISRAKAARLQAERRPLKLLFNGPYGTGKTLVANILAAELTGAGAEAFASEEILERHLKSSPCITRLNGKKITIETAREIEGITQSRSLFHERHALIMNECDQMTADAQTLLLTILDELPAWCAIVGTTNADVNDPALRAARFASRFHTVPV